MNSFHTFIHSKQTPILGTGYKLLSLFFLFIILSACKPNLNSGIKERVVSAKMGITSQIATNPIFDGGSTEITVTFKTPIQDDTKFKWNIVDTAGNAPTAFYVTTSDEIPLAKNATSVSFFVFSIPNSVNSGTTENFQIKFEVGTAGTLATLGMQVKSTQGIGVEVVTTSIVNLENEGRANLTNYTAYDISGLCSSPNGSIALTFTSGATSLTKNTVCDMSGNWSATTNLSSLAEGNVTVKAIHLGTSAQGETQRQFLKDVAAPTLAITSPAANSQISNITKNGFIVSGTCSENTGLVSLVFVSSGGGSVTSSGFCTSNLWSVSTNLSSLTDGTVTMTASHLDAANNSVSTQRTFVKDIVLPTLTISSHTFLTLINSLNYTTQTFSGSCNKNGSTVTLSGDVSGASLSAACAGLAWSVSNVTVSGADGAKVVNATVADLAGNTASTMVIVSKNATLPAAILSGTPGAISNHTALNVTVGGSGVVSYRYKTGDGSLNCTTATGYSASIAVSTKITGALGVDGSKKICVVGMDSYQNPQAFAGATIYSWTKDTAAPAMTFESPVANSYVNEVNEAAFVVSGTCGLDGVNNVFIQGSSDSVYTNCTSGTWSRPLDFSGLADGPVFVLAAQTNPDTGTVGQVSRLFTKYTISPSIAITSPATNSYINNANRSAFPVSGTCDIYSATPNISITGGVATVTTACSGTTWSATLAFNASINATPQVSATLTDVAGNIKINSRSFIQDTVDPTVAITSPSVGAYINVGNVSAFTMQGTCSDVGVGNVKIINGVTQLLAVDCAANNTWQANPNLSAIADGAVTLKVTHNDVASNSVEITRLFNKDVLAPSIAWTGPLANACMSAATAGSFTVEGSCTTADGNVTISSAQLTPSVTTSCTAGTFSRTLNLSTGGLADLAAFPITISQTDIAGNQTSGARSFKFIGAATPTIVFGGWEDVYAIGKKTYLDGNPSENGVVKIKWKDWPASNTCQPNKVKVLRGADTISSGVEREEVQGTVKQVTDTSLVATDFGKAWYYSLKVEIAGNVYDVVNPVAIQKIRVIAPPNNMALVHRWIANQETCSLIGKTTDPENNYRCSYNGQGKITRSAVNYNDMEHDILVDRFQLGCKISSTCGAGGNTLCSSENFSAVDNPSVGGGVVGAIGSVYYYTTNGTGSTNGKCWIKTGAADTNWSEFNSANTAQMAASSTSEAHVPVLTSYTQLKANQACATQTVSLGQVEQYTDNAATTFPSTKRLLRQKEWRAAASWDRTMSYPSVYGSVDGYIYHIEAGTSIAGDPKGPIGKCNTNNNRHANISAAAREFFGGYTISNLFFETGPKIATIDCQSRYGIQDMVGNFYEYVSDQLSCPTAIGDTCVGQTSTLDNENTDMLGFKFDGIQGPGDKRYAGDATFSTNEWLIHSAARNGTTHFNPILGIPLMSNTGSNVDSVSIDDWLASNFFHGDGFSLTPTNGNNVRALLLGAAWAGGLNSGRWFSYWLFPNNGVSISVGGRCGMQVN